jgi:thiol:disulfide interchange protein
MMEARSMHRWKWAIWTPILLAAVANTTAAGEQPVRTEFEEGRLHRNSQALFVDQVDRPYVRPAGLRNLEPLFVAQENAPPSSEAKPKLNIAEALGLGGGKAGEEAEHVTFSAAFQCAENTRKGTLSLTAKIDAGWHIYSVTQQKGGPLASKIKVAESPDFKVLGPFVADRSPRVKQLEIYKVPVEEHEGQVTWSAPIEIAEGVKPESLTIKLTYSGQVCSDVCIPIFNRQVEATFAGYTAAAAIGQYSPGPARGQVTFAGHLEPEAITAGDTVKLVITATPAPGWHFYAYSPLDANEVAANKPTLIVLNKLPGWRQSPVDVSPSPVRKADSELPYHAERVTWTIDLTAPADTPTGQIVVSGYLGYQTCKNQGGCLPPQAVQFRANLQVESAEKNGEIPLEFVELKRPSRGAAGATPGAGSPKVAAVGEIKGYRDVAALARANPAPTGKIDWASLFPVIGFSLLGGLILNLMPCVLPVIGLKVLSFAQQGGQSRGRIFLLNLWFAIGLLLVFVILATAAAFANLGWGQQFTYTWFKVTMVVVVFAFALSFLGVWEVPIPGFAQGAASDKLQQHEGASGAFFKGIFTTLLATPCSGPFLGPVFGYTLTQPPTVTYLIFFSVGLGMASPYLVIGAFPGLVKWLPKPGAWMETFKQLMGFVLLGTVVYLFSTINSDWFIPTLALVMGVWLACWWIGRVPVYEETSKQVWAWIGGCAAAALVGYLSFTFLGPVKHLYEWQTYAPDKIAALQAEGKTVMVDFTADWCLTCQANFRLAINTHRVKEVVEKKQIVPMLADWTDESEEIRQRLAELNSNSIPLLAIYPAGRPGEVVVLPDVISESQLLEALEKASPATSTPPATAVSGEAPAGAIAAGSPAGY